MDANLPSERDQEQSDKDIEDVILEGENNQKKKSMRKEMLFAFVKRASLVLLGYLVCYFNWTLALPLITILTLIWLEAQTSYKGRKIATKSKASSMTRKDMLKVIDELPSWVTFPDREKAEWLNEIIAQLWPSINSYLIKLFRGKLQTKIRKKFDSFKFEDIDFGETPPKIDSVKVYNRTVTKDSIIIDFEVYYDGNCDINFSMSGAQIGSIKDFQFGAELRIVLKPLMIKTPIIGGIQVFFLNTPDITFELEGISGIPGFSYFIRQKIEERITKKLVFPNKITKRFSKSVEAVELKSLEPAGVLRVHVFEAKELERKDVTGKSDPYVVLTVAAQENRTHVIKRDLNPKWDHWCEFVILDPFGQHLQFNIFDQDDLNEDDFLGGGIVEIHSVLKEGETDKWFTLDNAKHGKIHLRFTWLGLSSDRNDLYAASQETKLLKVKDINTGLLIVYIDNAENLPKVKSRKPDPFVTLTAGKKQQKSKVKRHTVDPVWEQGFLMFVPNPDSDSLNLTIIDKHSDTHLGYLTYNIRTLFDHPDLQLSKEEFPLSDSGKITLSLQLRILKNELFEDDESDSDSDVDFPEKRNNSIRSSTKSQRSMSGSSTSSTPQRNPQVQNDVADEVIEELVNKSKSTNIMHSPSFRVKPDLGQIEISISYSDARQKLIITVHRITNLPLKDPSDIPDPYVKLKLTAPGAHKIKNKTKVITDNCDPVFEETFEYLLSKSDLPNNKLVVTVKTKKIFFNSNAVGQVVISFNNAHDYQEPLREWYELVEAEDSD